MSPKHVLRLVFLRHGLSTGNHEGVVQGQQDFPLHQEGQEQAHSLGKYWKGKGRKFDLAISSTLQRALETAQIITRYLPMAIVEDPRWMEKHQGEAEGIPYQGALSMIAAHHTKWPIDEPIFEGGESEGVLFSRASMAVDSLLRLNHNSILVVSHGAIMNAALRAILGIPLLPDHSRPPGFSFDNTGYSELMFDRQESRWTILTHNIKPHLEPDV